MTCLLLLWSQLSEYLLCVVPLISSCILVGVPGCSLWLGTLIFTHFTTHVFLPAHQDILNCSWLMTVSHCSCSGKPLLLPFWALKFLLLLIPSACVFESGKFGGSFLTQLVKYIGPYSCYSTYHLYMGRVSVLQSSRSPSWSGAE